MSAGGSSRDGGDDDDDAAVAVVVIVAIIISMVLYPVEYNSRLWMLVHEFVFASM